MKGTSKESSKLSLCLHAGFSRRVLLPHKEKRTRKPKRAKASWRACRAANSFTAKTTLYKYHIRNQRSEILLHTFLASAVRTVRSSVL